MLEISRYTRVAMVLHWTIAVMIIANVALAWSFDAWPDALVRPAIDTHKSIGVTVLGLALLRVLWRAAHPPPAFPATYPRVERLAARVTHFAFYLLILAIPLSGWAHDSAWSQAAAYPMRLYGLVPWPRIAAIADLDPALKERLHDVFARVHNSLGYVLLALLALHVAGALKHQFWDRAPELQRMWPGRRGEA
jgi:cytochrome b561